MEKQRSNVHTIITNPDKKAHFTSTDNMDVPFLIKVAHSLQAVESLTNICYDIFFFSYDSETIIE